MLAFTRMVSDMEFTEAQRHKVDEISRKISQNETISADEALLFAEWKSEQAALHERTSENSAKMREELIIKIAACNEEHAQALENMNALHQAALDRFANID